MTERQSTDILFKPKILVVDDEKVIREGCREVLTLEGFEVVLAENGEQGLDMIEKVHFDVVLLDLMMSGISGFDVLSHIKALHPDTSIIVITGYATVEHSIEAMKNGAFDFIPKPFSPDQLRVQPGVVNPDIDAAKLFCGMIPQCLYVFCARYIAANAGRLSCAVVQDIQSRG